MNTTEAKQVPAVVTRGLSVHFGAVRAVQDLSIEVYQGDIFGFIGPNGAGKTTTIKTLVTLLAPTSGSAEVFGYDVRRNGEQVRRIVGYMPDYPAAYPHMHVYEYLEFFAAAYGLDKAQWRTIIGDVLELTDLKSKCNIPVGELSRGMQQRVSLARVLVHNPKLLVLDEPASGLDPRARIEVMEILRELAKMGKTVFISSHILSELRALCNRVAIIEKGSLVYCGTVEELLQRAAGRSRVWVRVLESPEDAVVLFAAVEQVEEAAVEEGRLVLTLADSVDDMSFIARTLVQADFRVQAIQQEEVHLEDAFMRITDGTVS